jgi:hypothetical protein
LINWSNLFLVTVVAISSTLALVALFSLGLRWLTDARASQAKALAGDSAASRLEVLQRTLAYVAFALCASALLYGIYLIVPSFHLVKS